MQPHETRHAPDDTFQSTPATLMGELFRSNAAGHPPTLHGLQAVSIHAPIADGRTPQN